MKYVWHIRVKTPNHGDFTATVEANNEHLALAAAGLQVRTKYPETRNDTFSCETLEPRPVVHEKPASRVYHGRIGPDFHAREEAVVKQVAMQHERLALDTCKQLVQQGRSFSVDRIHDEWVFTVQE